MSYILDALKKSEQQRGHGTTPGIQTIHSSSLSYRNEKKTFWPYILIVAVTLNLVAIIYFISDKNSIPKINNQDLQTGISESNQQRTVTKNKKPALLPTESVPVPAAIKNDTERMLSSDIEFETPAEQSVPSTLPAPAAVKEVTGKHAARIVEHEKPALAQKPVIDYHELPESTKRQLPAIIVSAHVYSSNPLQRSIVINNNFMEEGEYVLDDLVLHEITAEGAIFDYNNLLFHYSVISGWQ